MASAMRHKFLTQPRDLTILGAKFYKGAMRSGPEAGPDALIKAGLSTKLRDLKYDPRYESIDYHGEQFNRDLNERYQNMSLPRSVSAVTEDLSTRICKEIGEGRSVLTLGGDHSIGLGSVTGVAQAAKRALEAPKIGVIWVDAHGDINTPLASSSGHLHGMPLAWALGLAQSEEEDVFGWVQQSQRITPDKLVYIGIRDLDESEKTVIKEHNIKAFTMNDVSHLGIKEVMDQTLAHIGTNIPILMSFDIDGIDPIWAPGTGLPVDGGLSLAQGNYLATRVHETGQMVAMDMVEVNPKLDEAGKTVRAAMSIIQHAFGRK